MKKIFIGIDNGVTGTVGILGHKEPVFFTMPVIKQQSYTKTKQNISRIVSPVLQVAFESTTVLYAPDECIALIERPMINPARFKASISAARALEATLIALEACELPHQYIDSKEWQKDLLPSGLKGPAELKKASMDIGIRLFPFYKDSIQRHKDADGLLIAEYARRKFS